MWLLYSFRGLSGRDIIGTVKEQIRHWGHLPRSIEIRAFINKQNMHFFGTKKEVIQSTNAAKGITPYEMEQEIAHNYCL